jgi:putative ABC transport system permease protein
MTAVLRALGNDLRLRWRPMLGLALLLGLIGGAVLACAAGARRTDTAYGRLLTWAHAGQVQLGVPASGTDGPGYERAVQSYYRQVRALPGVEAASEAVFDEADLLTARGGLSLKPVTILSSPDNSAGVRADRLKILAGHLWRATDPHAVMVDRQLADAYQLRPGSTFKVAIIPNDSVTGNPEPGKATIVSATVSAVVAFDNQIVPATTANATPTALLSPAFARTRLAASASYGTVIWVSVQPGASVSKLTKAAAALARDDPLVRRYVSLYATDMTSQMAVTQRAIRPQAVALAAFAALAGLILLTVMSQLLARQLTVDSVDYPTLRSLGMAPRQLLVLSLARVTLVTAAGGALAVIVAILASPLTPIGPARIAEPQPGFAVNAAILGPGFALILLLPLALTLRAAWRTASRSPVSPLVASGTGYYSSRTVRAFAAGGSVARRIGTRMALQPGRGRTAVPVRSALTGIVIAVAATAAATVFGASFVHLLDTPAQYGQNWQQDLDIGFGGLRTQYIRQIAAVQSGLVGYAAGNYGQVSVHGTLVPAIGIDAFRGGGYVTVLSGHAPATDDEIALGAQTLRELHLRVGQRVPVVINGHARTMTVAGTAVLAAFGQGSIVATDLGSGAIVRAAVLSVPDPQLGCGAPCYNFFLARYGQGTSQRVAAAHLAATARRLGCPPGQCTVTASQPPSVVRNYSAVRDTPLVLGLVLAVLALGTLTHVLVTSVKRRRRELAVLKVLGMGRRQLLSVVLWQASVVSLVALAVGVPVGVLAGRWAWMLFARSAGAPGTPAFALLDVLAVIPVALLLACAVAAVPGRAAARVRPATALRAE